MNVPAALTRASAALGDRLARPLSALDLVRARLLALSAPALRPLFADRESRVAVYGIVAIAVALAATATMPVLLLAAGPLVLGVPHLVADVRYLVARPRLHRRAAFWLAVAAPSAASFVAPRAWIGLLAVAGAALAARAPRARRGAVFVAAVALALAAHRAGRSADVVAAHVHNVVAVAIFWAWARRRGRRHLAVVGAFAAAAVAILAGALDGAPFDAVLRGRLLSPNELVAALGPVADPALGVRLVLLFAFAQSVHYAVWVRLVPEDDRPRPGPRPFASSARALVADLGAPLVLLAVVVGVALAGYALVSLADARAGYLRLALFHGPLELGAATLLLLEGHLPLRARRCAGGAAVL